MSEDKTSVEGASQSSRSPIAVLYQRSVLDPMVEVARAISHDFVRRPRHYRRIPEKLAAILDGFRIRTGSNPEWPSAAQRADLFAPLFGNSFRSTSTDLRRAAVAFTERKIEINPDPLEDRLRNAAVAFRAYLKPIEGQAVSAADNETGPAFGSAIEVFQNTEVASLFGLPPAPGGNWPLDGALEADVSSADGAFLVEEIQRSLVLPSAITQHQFILLQRIAYYGALTIAGVLEDGAARNEAAWVRALVRYAYGWETALQSPLFYTDKEKHLQPRVVSQLALDDEELKSLPTEEQVKSSGVIFLQNGGGGGGGGKVTCLTGWTRICDNPHSVDTMNHSCTYGSTWYCDTGPTCTSGVTLKCDKWLVGDVRPWDRIFRGEVLSGKVD
jgi:hypothetical protein